MTRVQFRFSAARSSRSCQCRKCRDRVVRTCSHVHRSLGAERQYRWADPLQICSRWRPRHPDCMMVARAPCRSPPHSYFRRLRTSTRMCSLSSSVLLPTGASAARHRHYLRRETRRRLSRCDGRGRRGGHAGRGGHEAERATDRRCGGGGGWARGTALGLALDESAWERPVPNLAARKHRTQTGVTLLLSTGPGYETGVYVNCHRSP